jgi:transposase
MHEPETPQLERSSTITSLAPQTAGVAPAADCRGPRQGGPEALRARPSPGAPRQLTPDQLTRLPTLLERGPEASGFRGQSWTRKRVAEVLRREVSVVYHPTHVGRLLKAIRWSPQKPMRRARQRDEAAIARWRDATWPAIKKGRRHSSRRFSL